MSFTQEFNFKTEKYMIVEAEEKKLAKYIISSLKKKKD